MHIGEEVKWVHSVALQDPLRVCEPATLWGSLMRCRGPAVGGRRGQHGPVGTNKNGPRHHCGANRRTHSSRHPKRRTPACGHSHFNVPPVGGRKWHHGPVGTNSKAPGTTVDPAAVFAAVATQRDGLPRVGINTSSSTYNTTTIPAWPIMGVCITVW